MSEFDKKKRALFLEDIGHELGGESAGWWISRVVSRPGDELARWWIRRVVIPPGGGCAGDECVGDESAGHQDNAKLGI